MTQHVSGDMLFKALLTTFFEDFIRSFFPELARETDFSRVRFLPDELLKDVVESEGRYVDLLVETKLKDKKGFIFVHVEPQDEPQSGLSERMFFYFCRLYRKNYRRVLPIAVLGYEKDEEKNEFSMGLPSFEILTFQYCALELKRQDWRKYAETDNPAATALLAKMSHRPEERTAVRLAFLRLMARLKLDPEHRKLAAEFFGAYMPPMTEEEEKALKNELESLTPEEQKAAFEALTYGAKQG